MLLQFILGESAVYMALTVAVVDYLKLEHIYFITVANVQRPN